MKKRIALLCMLCGVLVLSGCGGSSGRVNDLERRVNVAEPLVEELQQRLRVAETEAETARTTAEAAQASAEAAQIRAELAETAKTTAEAERDAAVTAKTTAETERDAAVAARTAAEAARDAAVAARDTAIADRDAAQAARDAALSAQEAEEQRRQEAEDQRAELERLASQGSAKLAFDGAYPITIDGTGVVTAHTHGGLGNTNSAAAIGPNATNTGVQPKYNAPAVVTVPPISLRNSSTSSMGRWLKTTIPHSGGLTNDHIEIYSDVEAPKSVPLKDSDYNKGSTATLVDAQGQIDDPFPISDTATQTNANIRSDLYRATRDDAASGSFPRPNDGTKRFDVPDRGGFYIVASGSYFELHDSDTEATNQRTGLLKADGNPIIDPDDITAGTRTADLYTRSEVNGWLGRERTTNCGTDTVCAREYYLRNVNNHPLRYTADVSGTLGGASGTYRCGSGTSAATCTVLNTGVAFTFGGTGTWNFYPSSASVNVRVPDEFFMWFGWWSRQTLSTSDFAFAANHGCGSSTCVGDPIENNVTGTFTYRGHAAGRYAIYQPLGGQSGHGPFTADAVLIADFGNTGVAGTVSGTIENFRDHPDWELTLKPVPITAGSATVSAADGAGTNDGPVSWTIGDNSFDSDRSRWTATFYSNLAATERTDVVPYGMAGAFYAEHGLVANGVVVGKMVGAFGAHTDFRAQ